MFATRFVLLGGVLTKAGLGVVLLGIKSSSKPWDSIWASRMTTKPWQLQKLLQHQSLMCLAILLLLLLWKSFDVKQWA